MVVEEAHFMGYIHHTAFVYSTMYTTDRDLGFHIVRTTVVDAHFMELITAPTGLFMCCGVHITTGFRLLSMLVVERRRTIAHKER